MFHIRSNWPLAVSGSAGYWMFLDFIIGAFLSSSAKDGIFDQHPVSSIQHLPTNRNRLNHSGNGS